MRYVFGFAAFAMKSIAVLSSCILLSCCMNLLLGCDGKSGGSQSYCSSSQGTNRTKAVIVGMERSAFAGECPGARLDSDRMAGILSEKCSSIIKLQDRDATRSAVKNALVTALASSELVIFYYSGHGGSKRFSDTGTDESDGKDEFLCLYDGLMRDNDIWNIISSSRSRVMLIFDCCHSETMFRNPPKMTFEKERAAVGLKCGLMLATNRLSYDGLSVLVWSGCPDSDYSYGSSRGGKMTNSLIANIRSGITYDGLWDAMESDKDLASYEKIQRTVIGTDFGKMPVFR